MTKYYRFPALFLLLFTFSISTHLYAQNKKSISYSDYGLWKNMIDNKISNDGKWVCYQTGPEVGNSMLFLYNVESKSLDSINYVSYFEFSPNSDYLVYRISLPYDSLRKLKLAKTPEDKLPKDSLGIWFLANDSIKKIANIKSFSMAGDSSSILVYEVAKSTKTDEKKSVAATKSKKRFLFFATKKPKSLTVAKDKPQKGKTLVIMNPTTGKTIELQNVNSFALSYFGKTLVYNTNIDKDSLWLSQVFELNTDSLKSKKIFQKIGQCEKVTIDRLGNQIAFLYSADTNKTDKVYSLFFYKSGNDSAICIADTTSSQILPGWCPSINGAVYFSKDTKRLFFGVAQKPMQAIKDTLLPEEKFKVDVWSYHDRLLQPQQLRNAQRDLKTTYLSEYFISENRIIQLGDSALNIFRNTKNGNALLFLGMDDVPFQKLQSWDGFYADYYLVNSNTGSRELVLGKQNGVVEISPDENYLLYFNKNDSDWYAYDIKAREHRNLTSSIKVAFYEEKVDIPETPNAYGSVAWFANDKYVVLQDRYDFWKIDPTNKTNPINLTNGMGRKSQTRFNYVSFDPEETFLSETKPIFMTAFNEKSKENGFYLLNLKTKSLPEELISGKYKFLALQKAKNAERLTWRKGNFNEYYDLYTSTLRCNSIDKISAVNPQQSDFVWGTVDLVKWKSYDNEMLEGLLYKPENFDSTKQYPMIVYFYERYSDDLYSYYTPRPSYSTINFTEFVSNGYIVFVPDITYKIGYPGKSAYNSIISGTEFMKKNAWIDPARIGIQGQSWGGYQVAYLVTQTTIFACAEAGAPVSNMTSAYGGIRWSSGVNRAFQYEHGQSRIGTNMWLNRDLYIQNSPIFFADKVKTPILIMSNDDDGAVPWYQGIEYFCALRRLDKIAWLLTYNDDDHNLTKYPNRVDLSIRMMQFFDHYLKGKPAPEWMVNGIPATQKGKVTGYKLTEQ